MTDLIMAKEGPEAKIRRDRYGRYVLPHPETGEQQSWTRATTLAKTLEDRFGLEAWAKRNVVLGIGARPDLYAQASAAKYEDRDDLDQIVRAAETASGDKARANLGTALHRFTERIDGGEHDIQVPDPWAKDVEAYCNTMAEECVAVVEGWIERVVCVPELGVAGTMDRLCNAMEWQLPRVADLKTGSDVIRYGQLGIACQLALYAHASHWWEPPGNHTAGIWRPMPKVDQTTALVMHLPAGQGQCTLYDVDLEAGWQAVQLAVDVRDWRKRKGLLEPYKVATGTMSTRPVSEAQKAAGVSFPTAGGPQEVDDEPSAAPAPSPLEDKVNWDHPGGAWRSDLQPGDDLYEIAAKNNSLIAKHFGLEIPEGVPGHEPAQPSPTHPEWDPSPSAHAFSPEPTDERLAWLRDRIATIIGAGHGEELAGLWSQHDHIPTFQQGGPRTDEEIDTIAGACALVEMTHEMGFGLPDPKAKPMGNRGRPTPQATSKTRSTSRKKR